MKRKTAGNLNAVRQLLGERMPELRQRYGVKYLGVFGSYAHEQQKKLSDIDLLVEFDEHVRVTLIGFVALERELGTLLGHKVDLVERNTLKPVIGARILDEVIAV